MADNSDEEYPTQYRNSRGTGTTQRGNGQVNKPPRNYNGPGPNGEGPVQHSYDQSQEALQRNYSGPGPNNGAPGQNIGGPGPNVRGLGPNVGGQGPNGGGPGNNVRGPGTNVGGSGQLDYDRPARNFNGPALNSGELVQRNNDRSSGERPPSTYQHLQHQPPKESQYQQLAPGGRPPQGYNDYRTSASPYDNPNNPGPNRDSQHIYSVMGGPSSGVPQNHARQGYPHPQGVRGQGVPPPSYRNSNVYDNPVLETEHRNVYQPNMQQPPKTQTEPQFSNLQDMESNTENEMKPNRSQPTESQQQPPKNKATMILGKDMTVMKLYTASLAAWISLVSLVVSAFFYIIAFASAGWAVVDTVDSPGYDRRIGLWQSCHSQFGCTYLGVARVSDSFRAAQAFATMSLIVLMGSCAITVLYIAWQRVTWEDRSKLGKIAVGCRGLTVLLLFLTITIFGDRYRDGRYDTPAYSGRLSWAYGFATFVFFIEIGGCVLMALEVFLINKAPPRTQFQ